MQSFRGCDDSGKEPLKAVRSTCEMDPKGSDKKSLFCTMKNLYESGGTNRVDGLNNGIYGETHHQPPKLFR